MIIGLTGKNGAGKGIVSDYLTSQGFTYYSLSDMIREEIRKEGHEVTRPRLIEMGRRLRTQNGPSVLADLVLQKIAQGERVIVDSIRNPAEVESLRTRKDFVFLCVDADQHLRFERCKERGREGDPQDFETFAEHERRELENTDPAAQQLIRTAQLADHVVLNEGTKEECYVQVDKILEAL